MWGDPASLQPEPRGAGRAPAGRLLLPSGEAQGGGAPGSQGRRCSTSPPLSLPVTSSCWLRAASGDTFPSYSFRNELIITTHRRNTVTF